jgi:hypothetical protein
MNNFSDNIFILTVKKAKRDAGPKHVGDGKLRHPHKLSGLIYDGDEFFQSIYVYDGIFRHPHVSGLCHA